MVRKRIKGKKVLTSTLTFLLFIVFIFYTLHAARYTLESVAYAGIAATRHNLSTTGPGPVKATVETQICVFCHTPHHAVAAATPLWNRNLSSASYTVPSSTMPAWVTMKSTPQNPPDGSSKLCLSCHDGTIAIGSVVNLGGAATTISMQVTGYLTAGGMLSPTASGYVGTDLSGHHPISIAVNDTLISDKGIQCNNYEVSFRVCYPQAPIKLRATANMYAGAGGLGVQCATCHNPHSDPSPGTTKFLLAGTAYDTTELCSKCHLLCDTACP